MKRRRIRIVLWVGCVASVLVMAPRAVAVGLQPVGTFDTPIYVTAPPGDPRLFVVERGGTIQVLNDGVRTEFLDISSMVRNTGEQGLLSMAFDPNFGSNGLFYVFYNGIAADPFVGDIHIDEFKVTTNPNVVDPSTRRPVLTIVRGNSATTNHNGGQLQFGKDGLLYISVGDNANSANAQSTANLHGKILRIDPHEATPEAYTNPPGNPYVGVAGSDEIWSLGLRNPYRFSFDHLTGDTIIADVGGGSREEVDFAPAGLGGGANYGWPNCEGFSGFPSSCPGTTGPVFDYPHSSPCNAIIGGYVYRGSQIPELAGRYLYTDLCHPELRSMQLGIPLATGDRSEGVSAPGSPVSFGEDSSCNLYVMGSDTLDRIVGSGSASVSPACTATTPPPPLAPTPPKKKKCKRHRKHRKHHAAAAKKHKKKHCKKKTRKKRR